MVAHRGIACDDLKEELCPYFMELAEHASLGSTDDFFVYEPASYKGHSPLIFLNDAGDENPWYTKSRMEDDFFIYFHMLALYADPANNNYYEKQATALLRNMKFQLRTAIEAKRIVASKWQELSIEGRSNADAPEEVDGEMYLHEMVLLKVRCY